MMTRFGSIFGAGRFAAVAALLPALPAKPAWLAGAALKAGWVFGGLSRSAAHSLDKAILVIGLPPVFFFIAIFYYIYRRRGSWRGDHDAAANVGAPGHEAPHNRA